MQAPPGAGKTTRVPLFLHERALYDQRILMLEPRRVAARAAADRLAQALGERPGGRVGYRMRGDSAAGSAIEVVTEGVLVRMIQSDPGLDGVGCVIFDEFHERALQADLGLALVWEARGALRPDLGLLVMSATLDAGPVAALLGGAPVVTADGRAHPVETRWLDRPWRSGEGRGPRFEAAVADLAAAALTETEGGALVFLPGRAEIHRVARALAGRVAADVALQPLHGGLSLEAQRAALAPSPRVRKVVLSTAIAETSLTIPDVRVVIDGGLARRARHDPGSGMTRLVTERVTRAEADQRRGRAGRVGPGWCYRLWTRGEEGGLAAFPPPEIAAADLAGLALELALWGAPDAAGLAFLTPPPAPALAEARALLADLGALDPAGAPTAHGRDLAATPLHPRLGHMLLRAAEVGAGALAADLAALLEGRDILPRSRGADLAPRLEALRVGGAGVDPAARVAIQAEARRLRALAPGGRGPGLSPGAALSLAYPDRIGQRRSGVAPRFLLSGGKGARLNDDDALASAPFIVAADLDGDPREARIRRAACVAEAELRALHGDRFARERVCEWSRRDAAVVARERLMLGALALEDRPWADAPPEAAAAALMDGVRDLGLETLPWTDAARRFVSRITWLRAQGATDLPDASDAVLLDDLETWLAPYAARMSRAADLRRIDLAAALAARLDHAAARRLDVEAPALIIAPTGTRLPIDYSNDAPTAAVRLQEMFGVTAHPVVGPSATPVTLALLSPAGRPVQTTADLPGFWAGGYAEVRREMRGRYPKHPWPEDPVAAPPTRRAKPRGR